MAVPVLKLNLAPPPTFWRRNHQLLGWATLLAGILALFAAATVSVLVYRQARLEGEKGILSAAEARAAIQKQADIQDRLRNVDVEKELPVWRLAERILSERSLPWSRLTAELERSLVQDVRLKSIQRTRDSAQAVELKIRGEAKTRVAEEAFVASLRSNPFFGQVILERESERQGGGVDFDYTLPIAPNPPPYEALPKYGPRPKAPEPAAAPAKPIAVQASPKSAPTVQPAVPAAPSAEEPAPGVRPASADRPKPHFQGGRQPFMPAQGEGQP
jgi:hypothetical protein